MSPTALSRSGLEVICLGNLVLGMIDLIVPFCTQRLKGSIVLRFQISDLFLYLGYEMCSDNIQFWLGQGTSLRRPFSCSRFLTCSSVFAASASFLDCFARAVSESGGTEDCLLFAPLPDCFSAAASCLSSLVGFLLSWRESCR